MILFTERVSLISTDFRPASFATCSCVVRRADEVSGATGRNMIEYLPKAVGLVWIGVFNGLEGLYIQVGFDFLRAPTVMTWHATFSVRYSDKGQAVLYRAF